jgi:phosphoribosylaminoimidazole-succinocarboxamide synthase
MLVHRLRMLPVESIVRGYITGSGWSDYQRSGVVCGHTLPAGLKLCDRLPETIFTPSTKAEFGEHDENITVEQAAKTLGAEVAAEVQTRAKDVYEIAAAHAERCGVLVADTKMEFGVALATPNDAASEAAALVLGDEVLTPDCSRYWPADDYEPGRDQKSYDKQYVRDYLKEVHAPRSPYAHPQWVWHTPGETAPQPPPPHPSLSHAPCRVLAWHRLALTRRRRSRSRRRSCQRRSINTGRSTSF